jgi:5-methylcytosine-specific restriction endonuclease McrA
VGELQDVALISREETASIAVDTTPRRRWTRLERLAAYVRAEGLCQECKATLSPAFHVDHIVPVSAGGRTELSNARALCPKCNLEKGSRCR